MTRSGLLFGVALLAASLPARADDSTDLQNLSIAQLANIEVTSVSRRPEALTDAPAAVYVISHDDIMRSGATSLPEILRLAPNLQVAQMSADSYAITARGFNGNAADKLLVLIDGRSIYTPLYGGVMWDEKDVLPEDIERIEVISGPGATLWGANAVNGVINIITRKAKDTQGGVLAVGGGNKEARVSLQYGGALQDDLNYRVYGEIFSIAHDKTSAGQNAEDGWGKGQGGFRLDWSPNDDLVSLQGDIYSGAEDGTPTQNTDISGGNIQANWNHKISDTSSLQVLAYFDETRRFAGPDGGYAFDTYDLEAQHSFAIGDDQTLVWGLGGRIYKDDFTLTGAVMFVPPSSTSDLGDVFVQDSIVLAPPLTLTLGVKLEADPYSDLSPLPNARLSWKFDDKTLVWASYAYAIRAPTSFDTDLQDALVPGIVLLTGNKNFLPEKVRAFELGMRTQINDDLSLSVSTFYNHYDDLRTVEIVQETTLPFLWTWGNLMKADTYGVETWANYGLTDWWKLSAGLNIQHEDREFLPSSSQLGGVAQEGDDPNHQASLRSSMSLGSDVNWSADLRWIGMLPNPQIPAYVELNSKLGWNVSDSLEISLSGLNLLHAHHLEYEEAGATIGTEVDRSVFLETRWRF